MKIDKENILKNLCYTELVYDRINKKLKESFSKNEIEIKLLEIISQTPIGDFEKKGKNYYISNIIKNIKITVNSYTFRVITVDRITKE